MTIENRIFYIANDGKEFDNEKQCLQYEERLKEAESMKSHVEALQAYCKKNFVPKLDFDGNIREDVCQAINCAFHYGCSSCQLEIHPIDWEV